MPRLGFYRYAVWVGRQAQRPLPSAQQAREAVLAGGISNGLDYGIPGTLAQLGTEMLQWVK